MNKVMKGPMEAKFLEIMILERDKDHYIVPTEGIKKYISMI